LGSVWVDSEHFQDMLIFAACRFLLKTPCFQAFFGDFAFREKATNAHIFEIVSRATEVAFCRHVSLPNAASRGDT
jgi:hypothetical protein